MADSQFCVAIPFDSVPENCWCQLLSHTSLTKFMLTAQHYDGADSLRSPVIGGVGLNKRSDPAEHDGRQNGQQRPRHVFLVVVKAVGLSRFIEKRQHRDNGSDY